MVQVHCNISTGDQGDRRARWFDFFGKQSTDTDRTGAFDKLLLLPVGMMNSGGNLHFTQQQPVIDQIAYYGEGVKVVETNATAE